MSELGTCRLCGLYTLLRDSHVVPSFVGKWQKQASQSGRLVSAINPNKERQDLLKLPLLCSLCENRFSGPERKFREQVFVPNKYSRLRLFSCADWTEYFAVSLAYRTLLKDGDKAKLHDYQTASLIDGALNVWQDYLLGKRHDAGSFESHLVFPETILNQTQDEVLYLDALLSRVYSRLVIVYKADQTELVICSSLGGLILWTTISPPSLPHWIGSKIAAGSVVAYPQAIDGRVAAYVNFNHREVADAAVPRSKRKEQSLRHRIQNNPQKFAEAFGLLPLEAQAMVLSFLRGKSASLRGECVHVTDCSRKT